MFFVFFPKKCVSRKFLLVWDEIFNLYWETELEVRRESGGCGVAIVSEYQV